MRPARLAALLRLNGNNMPRQTFLFHHRELSDRHGRKATLHQVFFLFHPMYTVGLCLAVWSDWWK